MLDGGRVEEVGDVEQDIGPLVRYRKVLLAEKVFVGVSWVVFMSA